MASDAAVVSHVVSCPECQSCTWCSWYAKNARESGCGSVSRRKCEWGETLKGTTCPLCSGAEKVRFVGRYESLVTDPIAAAVDAELQPLADALTDIGHKLAKDSGEKESA
jgi:hypothetical protein